jgi:hypothetical protein
MALILMTTSSSPASGMALDTGSNVPESLPVFVYPNPLLLMIIVIVVSGDYLTKRLSEILGSRQPPPPPDES